MKKTFKLKVTVTGCNTVFMEGEDAGVIAVNELTYDLPEYQYEGGMFAVTLMREQEELLKSTVVSSMEVVE